MGTDQEKTAEQITLIGAIDHLALTVQQRTDQLRRFNYFVLVVLLFLFMLATWNRTTLTYAKDTLATMESITNPEGELYQRSQLRTRAILQENAVENDCRNRRRNANLPAPELGTLQNPLLCKDQTPSEIYPGTTTTIP